MRPERIVEVWDETHPRWAELWQVVEGEGQAQWASSSYPWHLGSYMLVARQGAAIVGFLRFVTQIIGADENHEPLSLHGAVLTEAKVLAFGVPVEFRRQGIGRALQEAALEHARALGCYQLRSHSGGDHFENHELKLRMGFGVHPIVRGDDKRGVYFVMPLRTR